MLVRWLMYGAISVMIGAALFHWVILERVVSPGPERKALIRRSVAGWGTFSALVLVLAVTGVLGLQLLAFKDPFEPLGSELRLLVTRTGWGRIWTIQWILSVFSLASFNLARARPAGGVRWIIVTIFAFACGLMPALSGHSYGTAQLSGITIAADILHVWAAGAWIGLLTLLTLAARKFLLGESDVRGTTAEWIQAFSPVALGSFGVLFLTGSFAAWIHVGNLGNLVGTPYGRILSVKLIVVGVVVALGFFHWKRVTPHLATEEAERRFLTQSAPSEAAIGWLVLLVTGLLVASTLPIDGTL